jgi:hypothetical protein
MEEWMWKKIIEKMYDPKDYEILDQKFHTMIEEKKIFNKTRTGTIGAKLLLDTAIQASVAAGNKKLTREELL